MKKLNAAELPKANNMEIKPESLRIGNLIQTDAGIETVLAISSEAIQTPRYKRFLLEDCKTVKPSAEWLIKAGFEKVKGRIGVECAFIKSGIRINMSNSGNFYYHRWNTLDSIHSIQNLFYSVDGQELTFNPTQL